MKKPTVLIICACIAISVFMTCASYGAGGVYTAGNQSEMGGYVFGNSDYAEATLSYTTNLSGKNTQSLGAGFSFKIPYSIRKNLTRNRTDCNATVSGTNFYLLEVSNEQ